MTDKLQVDIRIDNRSASIPIREFVLDKMVDNPSIVMIAKRRSGKSWVVRAILHHCSGRQGPYKIPAGIIISPTDRLNRFYGDFVPDTFIHFEFSSELVERIMNRQMYMKERSNEREKLGKKTNIRAFLVMDDCLADKGNWTKDKRIYELLFNGRHYQITYILTMQYPLGIKPELRTNFDYVFLLADDTVSNQKKLFDHYAGMFPCFEAFRQVFTQITADYGSFVIDNTGKIGGNAINKICHYKAPDLSKTKVTIGGRQYNEYHNNNYNPKWMLNNNLFKGAADTRFDKENLKKKGLVIKKVKYDDNDDKPKRKSQY